ncbi:hypothetical protein [Agrobacterium vitis]|uniref:hypothetical protein n=1 Tax=Agrobacterium vitis TaxID=373 RepID=UPI0012E8959A|nr:hypothetical protein [Agrobacterium vitis]MVA63000.1 hypothetical protein [Agrobacterium vitis]
MSKLRMMGAYFGAIVAGVAVSALIALAILIPASIASGKIGTSQSEILGGFGAIITIFILYFIYAIPVSLITAAPFTLICTSLIGIAWNATHRNSIILGALCPLVSTAFFTMLFIMPTTSPPDPESNRFNDYILPALVVGVALIPSGAVAGSVFWRLGLRPKASPSKPALQVKS